MKTMEVILINLLFHWIICATLGINEVVPVSSGDEDNAVSMSIARKQVPGPKTRAKIKEILNSYK